MTGRPSISGGFVIAEGEEDDDDDEEDEEEDDDSNDDVCVGDGDGDGDSDGDGDGDESYDSSVFDTYDGRKFVDPFYANAPAYAHMFSFGGLRYI
jgi:hypothetical protein